MSDFGSDIFDEEPSSPPQPEPRRARPAPPPTGGGAGGQVSLSAKAKEPVDVPELSFGAPEATADAPPKETSGRRERGRRKRPSEKDAERPTREARAPEEKPTRSREPREPEERPTRSREEREPEEKPIRSREEREPEEKPIRSAREAGDSPTRSRKERDEDAPRRGSRGARSDRLPRPERGDRDESRSRGRRPPRGRGEGRRAEGKREGEAPPAGASGTSTTGQRVAVFVDVTALEDQARDHGGEVSYRRLMRNLTGSRPLIRAVAYVDPARSSDPGQVASSGFEVEPVEGGADPSLLLAIDAMGIAPRIDCVVLAPENPHLQHLARTLRSQGLRVETAGFSATDPGFGFHRTLGRDSMFVP